MTIEVNVQPMTAEQFQDEMETIIQGFIWNNADELRDQFVEEFGKESYKDYDLTIKVEAA